MSLPRHHRSDVAILGPLVDVRLDRPQDETPLFAATRAFAAAEGGPITRAFLDALPPDWSDVVVDSSLVWLTPGLAHDEDFAIGDGAPHRAPPPFRHEPFPGCDRGVRGAANRNRGARHRLCVVGLDCAPVFAVGDVELGPAEDPEAFWLPTRDLAARDQRIRTWLATGRLRAQPIPTATVVEYGWGALYCPRPAATAGFQLLIRATHGDPRPRVDGRRNVTFV